MSSGAKAYLSVIMQRANFLPWNASTEVRSHDTRRHVAGLTIKIWYGIGCALGGWIHPVLHYMLVELSIACLDKLHRMAIHESPECRAKNRSEEISQTCVVRVRLRV